MKPKRNATIMYEHESNRMEDIDLKWDKDTRRDLILCDIAVLLGFIADILLEWRNADGKTEN